MISPLSVEGALTLTPDIARAMVFGIGGRVKAATALLAGSRHILLHRRVQVLS